MTEEARMEKQLKEKLQRERDTLAADKYSLEKQVEVGTYFNDMFKHCLIFRIFKIAFMPRLWGDTVCTC